jgi:hypothetical protein
MPSLFNHVEIEINTTCDMGCFGCDRLVDVAPTGPMSVSQIRHFVDESLSSKWEWVRMHILGGEPTLHPQIREIVAELIRYRDRYPDVLLRVISNGQGRLEQHAAWLQERHIEISVAGKQKNKIPPYFRNTRVTPYDEDPLHCPKPPCAIYGQGTGGCGIGLTKHGMFLCGAGASIARVIGADIGVMRLSDLTHEVMLEQAERLCHVCGHWNPINGPCRKNSIRETGQITGGYWTAVLSSWTQPPMSHYGPGPNPQSNA